MRLPSWLRKFIDRDSAVGETPEDIDVRLADAARAAEASERALASVQQKRPRVQAHATSMRKLSEDNGLAAVLLYGFRR